MRGITMTTVGLAAMLALAGCDSPNAGGSTGYSDAATTVEMIAPMPGAPAIAPPGVGATASTAVPVQTGQIAYVYDYGLEVPAGRAAGLMRQHERACVAAGPAVCQVVGAETNAYGQDTVSASLEMRAVPAFLTRFRAGLEGDAQKAGGRVVTAATSSEDLTRQLSDTEARLRALSTLRDRLEQLLATRSAPLDQLLATERELARVQGELDATTSALAVMRTRVAMSRITIDYKAERKFASESVFSPVGDALKSSLRVFMGTLGVLIYTVAVLAPLGLLIVPLVWVGLKWRRRRLAERKGRRPADG